MRRSTSFLSKTREAGPSSDIPLPTNIEYSPQLEAPSLQRRTLGSSTHRGPRVLDSLRYGLKALGSGQVPLLSDILTDTEGVQLYEEGAPVYTGRIHATGLKATGEHLQAQSYSYDALRRTLGSSTHRGPRVLDSLRYGVTTLGSGQVPLLSDILTDTEGAQKHAHTGHRYVKHEPRQTAAYATGAEIRSRLDVRWPTDLRGVNLESRLPVFMVMVSVNSTSLAGEANASL
ncbi:hypothetical protein EYF80_003237 [Liparis tanakae]|uniref:Uncharacterized protein n=1 Tax=Liparis tanakae TaxID=230148 RepID=A0A4Z2J8W7_9TELE|nr:hypothetical protein EYF80_003237 [Liparis tanakae]